MVRGSFLCAVYFLFNQRINDMKIGIVLGYLVYGLALGLTAIGLLAVHHTEQQHLEMLRK